MQSSGPSPQSPLPQRGPADPLLSALVRAAAEIAWSTAGACTSALAVGHRAFTGEEIAPTDGEGWLSLVHPDDRPGVMTARRQNGGDDDLTTTSYRLRHRSGDYRWVEERMFPVRTADDQAAPRAGVIIDVDDRVRLEHGLRESEERLRLATSAGCIGIWDVDLVSGVRRWSADLKAILGVSPETPESESLLMSLICPEDQPTVLEAHRKNFDGVGAVVFRIRRADTGAERWMESTGRVLLDASGRPVRRVGTLRDITAQKHSEALLEQAASQDSLTGLANRQVFTAALERLIRHARSVPTRFAVVLIDLDHFKMINDTLGHESGDFVLKCSAERLRVIGGPDAVVARLGGDEFALLLHTPGSVADLAGWAAQAAAILSMPIWFNRTEIVVSSSLGAAIYPDQEHDAADLLKSADLALYASKRAGRARASLFEPAMRAVMRKRATALRRAREALIRDEIVPFYQPKVSAHDDREVEGFEALLRWRDDGTIKPPAALAEALEDPELSVQIGARMVDLVIADIRRWTDEGVRFGSVAVNVAGSEFTHGDIAELWLSKIRRAGIEPNHLQIEVTETVFLGERSGEVGRTLERLSRAGIKAALDDFGTGYASLTHLRTYPVDVVKIDKSFIDDIERDAGTRAIVRGLIALTHELGIKVVAEGVETRDQHAVLARESCDFIQGYLIAKPMAATRVRHFVNAWTDGRPEIRTSRAVASC